MQPALVVEATIAPDRLGYIAHRFVGLQIHLLILQRLPETLDEDVVAPATRAIYAGGDAARLELANELRIGELAALVGVDDLGFAVPHDRVPGALPHRNPSATYWKS